MRPSHRLCTALAALLAGAPLAGQWGPVATVSAPSPRADALLTYDVFANRLLLFGGNGTNEVWSLAGSAWTQLTPSALPGPRIHASLSTMPLLGEVLLYGGLGGGQFALDETWRWDGTTWQQLTPTASPGGLYRHVAAFDEVRQTTVLFGGRQNSWHPTQAKSGTWEFANGTWTLVTPIVSPPGLVDAAMTWHPGLNQVVLFGGRDSSDVAHDETWTYDGTTWQQISTTGPRPSPRIGARMVPLLGTNSCMLCGGRDPVTMQILNDTWHHDGADWIEVTHVYAGMYPPRADFAIAHDFARNRIVAFGGVVANNGLRDDTWEYGAQFQPFGIGCSGTAGIPTMAASTLPVVGAPFSGQITNLPAASPLVAVLFGVSRTQWIPGSLPMLLTQWGMPGCRVYQSMDEKVLLPVTNGTAAWNWLVPGWPGLGGLALHMQVMAFDPGVNAAGQTMSGAATIVLGN